MSASKIGILHPGEMGISVAASMQNSGHDVYWVSAGRSQQTQDRAAKTGLLDAESLLQLCATCEIIVSVCPPAVAESVADEVITHGFAGLYVDANAISPQKVQRIAQMMADAGVAFVDGSIIGGPAWTPGSTWLYLSGAKAQDVVSYFADGPLETEVVGEAPGKASALKMCFAAYTKGTTALLSAIVAAAEELDVRQELEGQWSRNGSDFAAQTRQHVRNVTAKAWRFVGEMEEIATTLDGAGMPGDFHRAAAEVYRRMADFKDEGEAPPLEDVLAALLRKDI